VPRVDELDAAIADRAHSLIDLGERRHFPQLRCATCGHAVLQTTLCDGGKELAIIYSGDSIPRLCSAWLVLSRHSRGID
jgi:hypothetical protein